MADKLEHLRTFLTQAPPEWHQHLKETFDPAATADRQRFDAYVRAQEAGALTPRQSAALARIARRLAEPPDMGELLAHLTRTAELPPEEARPILSKPMATLAIWALGGSKPAEAALATIADGRSIWAGQAEAIIAYRLWLARFAATEDPDTFGTLMTNFYHDFIDGLPRRILRLNGDDALLRRYLYEMVYGPFATIRALYEECFRDTKSAAVSRVRHDIIEQLLTVLTAIATGPATHMLVEMSSESDFFDKATLNVRKHLSFVICFAALTALEQGIEISVKVPPSLCYREGFNKNLLATAVRNLVGNAVNYRDPGKPASRVEVGWDIERWSLYVKDNGIGIEDVARVLKGNYRELRRFPQEIRGTGSGIANARQQLGSIGWKLACESTVGLGTTFFLHPAALDVLADVASIQRRFDPLKDKAEAPLLPKRPALPAGRQAPMPQDDRVPTPWHLRRKRPQPDRMSFFEESSVTFFAPEITNARAEEAFPDEDPHAALLEGGALRAVTGVGVYTPTLFRPFAYRLKA